MFPRQAGAPPRHPHLFSAFLESGQRMDPSRDSLGFSVSLRVLVPTYQVNKRLWLDDHYEGGYLFSDKINLEAIPDDDLGWKLKYGFDSGTPNRTTRYADPVKVEGGLAFRVPVKQDTTPGIDAELVLTARSWE